MTAGKGRAASLQSDLLFPTFFLRHSRGIHGNPVLSYVRLPSPVTMAARPQKTQRLRRNFPSFRHSRASLSFSVILGPCPGIQSFSGKDQDWIPAFGENDGGEGMARMTAGKGRAASLQSDLLSPTFFFRHSRGIHGNPVLSCVRLPSPVTMAARPQKNLTATPQFPVLLSSSRPARESSF